MSQWKFQFCPNEKDVIAAGYRMDDVGAAVEREVNDALRYPFGFHGINKVVIRLGLPRSYSQDYIELLGVGIKQYADFSARDYLRLPPAGRRECLLDIVKVTFSWFLDNFDDAFFVEKCVKNLGWTGFVRSA